MTKVIKWVLGGLVAVLGLVTVIAVTVVALFDPNDFRDEFANKVTQQTGREFKIEGEIEHSFFPWLGFRVGAMELGNAAGFGEQPFARIESADVRVKLLPLLRMEVEMDTVTLHGMALRLQRKADGSSNWDDLAASEKTEVEAEAAPAQPPEKLLAALQINGIEVRDARVLWDDAQGGQRMELKEFNLTSGAISLADPIPLKLSGKVDLLQPAINGGFSLSTNVGLSLAEEQYRLEALVFETDLHGEVFPGGQLKATLQANAMADLKQQLAELSGVKLTAMGVEIRAGSKVARLLEAPTVQGDIKLTVNDGKAVTLAVAEALPPGFKREALNGAGLSTNFKIDLGEAQSLNLSSLKLSALGIELDAKVAGSKIIDKPRFQGELKSNTFVPRELVSQLGITLPEMADPSVLTKAALNTHFDVGLDHAGLNKLALQFDRSTLSGSARVSNFATPVIRYNLSLDDIDVDRYLPPPSEEAVAASPESAPEAQQAVELPLELMLSLDIDGRFRVGKVKVMNLSSNSIDATLKAKKGDFRLHPLSAKLYQGGYSGNLNLDVQSDTPRIAMDESLTGVQAGPLLKDFMGKDYVTGKANLAAKLTARGLEPDAIRKSLSGSGNFSFDNGQINGLNFGQRIREAYALYKREPKPAEELKQTDFSRLSGSFTVTNGVVKTSDLSARSTLFEVAGKGTVNLVREKLDLRLDTKVVSDIRDATGQRTGELTGEVIPVTIKGSFSEPDIGVDVASVLKAKLKSAVDEKKREAQEKLDQKKREAQQQLEQRKQEERAKLEQQKREAEEKAKKRLDEKKQDLQKDLDQKLKNMLKF